MKRAEELADLKNLIRCLKGEGSARLFIRDSAGNDLTARELVILEKELAYLERVVAEGKKNA